MQTIHKSLTLKNGLIFLLITISLIKFIIGFICLDFMIRNFNCSPCVCRTKEIWKRSSQLSRMQMFYLNCYATEITDDEDSKRYFVPDTMFFARRSCTVNCSSTYLPPRKEIFETTLEWQVLWIIDTCIWLASAVVYLYPGALGVMYSNIWMIILFKIYIISDFIMNIYFYDIKYGK